MELSRPVRPWEFLDAVGPRAGLFGWESGKFEAWVYPLKILRDFSLTFHYAGRAVPAETLARTVIARPESCTMVYAGDSFSVRETFFVPRTLPGAVIELEVDTLEPLEVEASFQRDLQLMWPAGLGGTYSNWSEPLRAFVLGEEQKKFFALVGSPSAAVSQQEFSTNYSSSPKSSFMLGRIEKGRATKLVVIAASFESEKDAENTYRQLSTNLRSLHKEAAEFYRQYLEQTVSLKLPDRQLQRAYDWSRVSMVQGMVRNPFLRAGLVAGYRTSGEGARPGFAWFFGRDALWTTLALDSAGDFATARTALDFLSKYQRADGKVEHELSQSANFVSWFKDYPYGFASADATPLFILALNDYVVSSGDTDFGKAKWDNVWRAYQFLRSTWDAQGLPQNQSVGHGWVEGGPLLPVKTELYQSGLGLEALRSLSSLARLTGKSEVAAQMENDFAQGQSLLNRAFWSPEKKIYAFALNKDDQRLDTPSVLATVPMWFGLLDADKASLTINELANWDHAADWGMRIISSQHPMYHPSGYHFGSVWPLFTGWASVGEYRYHRAIPAYANLHANAQLALDGALGRVTEVLSGTYYQGLSTSSPHQIWSSAMVVSPLLRGLFGLSVDATNSRVRLAPHLPADWKWFEMRSVQVGNSTVDVAYSKDAGGMRLEVQQRGAQRGVMFEFSPSVSPRAHVLGVEANGRRATHQFQQSSTDQHISVRMPLQAGKNVLRIRLRGDFGITVPAPLPELGGTSRNLKVVSESWSANHDTLTLEVAGLGGSEYELRAIGSAADFHLDGAEVAESGEGETKIRIRFPGTAAEGYKKSSLSFRFTGARRRTSRPRALAGEANTATAAR